MTKQMENSIIHGDIRNFIHKLPKRAFLISDPPYNRGYHYHSYKDTMKAEEYREMLALVFGGRKSVIIHYPEETINLLGGGRILGLQEVVSWVYPSNTAKQSRLITWWNCRPDMRAVGQPYKNPTDKRIAKRIADGKQARLYDYWEINQVKNVSKAENPHPCPIPYELAKRIILTTTKRGDLVIDPFVGSGTIALAARDTGRKYLGFDVEKKYVELARKRLKKKND